MIILLAFVPVLLLVAAFTFFVILPMRNQDKKDKEIQESLAIGDEIVTNGGIRGLVTQIDEDSVKIETGGNRSKLTVEKWAIAKTLTSKD